MRRQSTSSASTSSTASTAYSYAKDEPESLKAEKPPRRGLRQKARDVVSDFGAPPTKRQDAKDGKHTSNFGELGILAEGLMKPGRV